MEIDVARKPGRPKKFAPKRSVARVYEMAWVGTVSLVDRKGEALHTIRYGATGTKKPASPEQLLESMQGDVNALLARHKSLKVAAIADGAKDIIELLDTGIGCFPSVAWRGQSKRMPSGPRSISSTTSRK